MTRPYDRGRLFRYFFLRYLAAVAIVAAVGIPIYALVVSEIRQHEVRNRLDRLEQFQTSLEAEFRTIDELVYRLSWSEEMGRVLSLSQLEYGSPEVYRTIVLRDYLAEQLSNRSVVHDIAVYFSPSDILVSAQWIVYRLPMYYGPLFQIRGVDYETWRSRFLQDTVLTGLTPSLPTVDRSEAIPLIFYSRRIAKDTRRRATIIAMLDERRVRDLFVDSGVSTKGRYQIVSATGEVLSVRDLRLTQMDVGSSTISAPQHGGAVVPGGDAEAHADSGPNSSARAGEPPSSVIVSSPIHSRRDAVRDDLVTLEVESADRGWTIRVDIPGDEVLADAWRTGSVVQLAMAGALMLGIILSFLLARQVSSPIGRVLARVHSALGGQAATARRGLALVEEEVSALLEHDRLVSERLRTQRATVKAVYVDRLLKGQVDRDEVDAISSMVGIDLAGGPIQVALITLNRDPESVSATSSTSWSGVVLVARERVLSRGGPIVEVVTVANNRLAVFVRAPHDEQWATVHNWMQAVADDLTESLHLRVLVGLGDVAGSPYEIWRSYQSATAAVEAATFAADGSNVRFDTTKPEDHRGYYYPLELESEIAKLARAGDEADLVRVLDTIIEENRSRALELAEEHALLNELQATLHKTAAPLGVERSPLALPGLREVGIDWDELEGTLRVAYGSICHAANTRKLSHNRRLAERIKTFIDDNIGDPQLSLGLVADEFSLSETYVSHFLAEQYGEPYSRYVERQRMACAQSLLIVTQDTVEEIARAVGYTSAHGFRRAFKRVIGRNPNDVRRDERSRSISDSAADHEG